MSRPLVPVTADPSRLPVVVGVADVLQRPDDPTDAVEAVALMEAAARAAEADAGADLLGRLDAIAVVRGAWSYPDPARILAERFGARATTILTRDGGNVPVSMLATFADRIVAGELDAALLVGGEVMYSRRKKRAAGVDEVLTTQDTTVEPDEVFGAELHMASDAEKAAGLEAPVVVYPLLESAIGHARGASQSEHRAHLGRLYARFSEIAAANPYAWIRRARTAAEVAESGADNRMIGFPYTKAMNSNWWVDQAAAVLVVAAGTADALGVPRDRWVHLHAATEAHDTPSLTERPSLASSASLAVAGPRLLELTGVGADDLGPVDLYSCFPSAVELAADALGLGEDRDLTLTGGMSFFGGPLNDYATHSVTHLVRALRDDTGAIGLTVANGGYATKHALLTASTEPPAGGWRHESCQEAVDTVPRVVAELDHAGVVTIEAFTVVHDSAGEPEHLVAACRTPSGGRCWARATDPDLMAGAMATGLCGHPARRDPTGHLHLT